MTDKLDIIISEVRANRSENRKQFSEVFSTLKEHGERIIKTETRVSTLIPTVKSAKQTANGAATAVAKVEGQWSAGWKIFAGVMGASIVALGGWLIGVLT